MPFLKESPFFKDNQFSVATASKKTHLFAMCDRDLSEYRLFHTRRRNDKIQRAPASRSPPLTLSSENVASGIKEPCIIQRTRV